MLFPKSYIEPSEQVLLKFKMLGIAIGKALLDDRLIDISLSPLMWHLVLGKRLYLHDLRLLDISVYKVLNAIQTKLNQKSDQSSSEINDYCLTFCFPSDSNIILLPNGNEVDVTSTNAQEYIDLVV